MRMPRDGILPASERVRLVRLDVTDPGSIAAAVEAAVEAAGPIDGPDGRG